MNAKAGQPQLTILIPTLNEEKRIGATLKTLAHFLKERKYDAEVVVVDALSDDNTEKVARAEAKHFASFRYLQTGPKVGKGKQVRDGMFAARGKYIMFMDADLATPLKYLDDVYSLIHSKRPIGICVRNLSDSHTGLRKFISTFGNWLTQTLLVPGIQDTQCGFKVFDAQVAKEVFGRQRIVGWGFDMEILAVARKLGYSIELIEVPDWKDVVEGSKISGGSGFKSLQVALQVFIDLLSIKLGLLTGRYRKVSFRYVPYQAD
ncbi:glycosyltransferase [bacterium]|nr:glycosyltransferase [bacterium]